VDVVRCRDRHIDVHQSPLVEALQDVCIDQVHLEPRGPHRCLACPQLGRHQLLSLTLGCEQRAVVMAA